MNTLIHGMKRFVTGDEGVVATEYAVLLSLITLTAMGSMTALGQTVDQIFWDITSRLPTGY